MTSGAMPKRNENAAILRSFPRALTREAHVLTQHPNLLWQQLYNRLQWEGDDLEQLLASERDQCTASYAKP
jgi:hypothetical protein